MYENIKQIVKMRWIVVSGILAAIIIENILQIAPWPMTLFTYAILGLEYLLNVLWTYWVSRKKFLHLLSHLQTSIDIILIMAAIYLVGGIENTWGFVPALIIILAGVYFSFSTGIFLALMSIFLFAAMAFGEIYGFIPHFSAYGFSEEIWKNTNYVLDYVTGMAVLYFSSAFVSGYFGQRIRESNILLEKEVSTLRARLEKKLEETNAELYQRSKELESILAERRQMEGALRESEGRLRTILDTIQLGIVIIDAKTHLIIDANPVAVEMIGTPKEKITGHICHKFICPAEVGKCPITDLGQIVDRSERKLVKANGETVPILKTVTRMILGGSEHLVESFIDITERKRAEEELKKRAEELEKMNKFMVGRELDMIELKKEVNQLLKELGRTEKYTT